MAGNGLQPRQTVVSKVVAIVRSFGSGGALTVTEIARMADLPLSTVHRLAHELAAWDVLHRRDDGRYEIGLSHRPCGGDGLSALRTIAAPVVEDLGAVMHSDVRLGVLDGIRVAYVEKTDGCRPLTDFSDAATVPVHATALGKALLAFSPPRLVDDVVRAGFRSYSAATVATAAGLRQTLKETRLRGIAIARGELLPDHHAVAAPVFGVSGEVTAALEVRLRDVRGELPVVVPALVVAARGLSRELGQAIPTTADPPWRGPRPLAPVAFLDGRRIRSY